jgi:hypothetical protein
MPKQIEDELAMSNWLSVLTFDVFKWVGAGGALAIEWAEDGLTLRLLGVSPDSDGINPKFWRLAEAAPVTEEATP